MPETDTNLGGKVVAVTGGARGIGRAIASELTRRGARVAIGDLDIDLAEATAAELGGSAIALELDVTDRDSFAAFVAAAEEQLGPLDALINNAGIMPIAHQRDEPDATAHRVVDINVHGVIYGSKLALERMLPRGRGHIVNIASQAGKVPFGALATYCASKYAVVGYTASLQDELRGTGVHATCVLPAIVRTELSEGLPKPRLIKPVEPGDVATAIANALTRPRRTIHIPRSGGVVLAVMSVLPPSARRALEKALGMEHGVKALDPGTRSAYEQRAAREVTGTEAEKART